MSPPPLPRNHVAADRDGQIALDVSAVIIASTCDQPSVLVIADGGPPHLPASPVTPALQLRLDDHVRMAVNATAGVAVGYVEQLCTLDGQADKFRANTATTAALAVCVSYLALTAPCTPKDERRAVWSPWYAHFPWEDWREGKPALLGDYLEPALAAWAARATDGENGAEAIARRDRVRMLFGVGGTWDEERVADRFVLLDESGLLERAMAGTPGSPNPASKTMPLGRSDAHRLALAMGRLRAKMKYRPVVFEMMPKDFTLFELQRVVEALLGTRLHKQNFRRLVETTGLVEATGEMKMHTGGRPAKLVRFRREVLLERAAPGVRVKGQHT